MSLKKEQEIIVNKTKGKLPSLPFVSIKNSILGEKYDLSLVFVSKKYSHQLNKKFREKNYPANILSFPLSKNSGEIFINLDCVKKDTPLYEMPAKEFLKFLFIHGLLHLKGMDHSSTMENEEQKFLKKFQ